MQYTGEITPEREGIRTRIHQMMDESYGCAESLVTALGEHLWGEVSDELKMVSTGYSGGVGGTHEELCGGVSGAAILLGKLYGRTTNQESKMVQCKRLIAEHRDLFIQEFGTTTCQKLRDAEYGSDEKSPCSALIVPAALMLLDVLEAEVERARLTDSKKVQIEGPTGVPFEDFVEQFQAAPADQLLAALELEHLPHRCRDWIGDRLDALPDPRPGVNLDPAGIPNLVLLPVQGGKVEIERAGEYQVQAFRISKYPITYQQYQGFIDAEEGFTNPAWWTGLAVDPEHRQKPGEQRFQGRNYPRDNVSWFDGVAYCRWLTEQVRKLPTDVDVPGKAWIQEKGLEFRLPTEWEWQMAATGGRTDQTFPWGKEWDDRFAHTKHNQLNKTMAVGMYPAGISPIGALDMSGNLWEWCLNCYQNPGALDYSRTDRRVLRGGSWYHWGSYARTDMRSRYYPDHRYNAGGFRVVCASAI